MKILLVDDEKLQLIRLTEAVKKALPDENDICSYTNPVLAWEENKSAPVDIAFLDIEMPVISGIMLAKKLKTVNPKVNVIFVTAYSEYALDAHRLHASGYVTKPVNEEKIKEELSGLRFPVELLPTKKLQVKCFGNFEVFYGGKPVKFLYRKSKELFAYLIDREGSSVNISEMNAVLWEEDHSSYLRNLLADVWQTLKNIDCQDVFIKNYNAYSVDVTKIDCDAYEYKKGNPNAVMMYRGEYMMQYSWPLFNDDSLSDNR